MAADSPGRPRQFSPAGINAGPLANPLPRGKLRPGAWTAPARAAPASRLLPAMAAGYCRQYAGAQSGYRVTIVLSDRGRLPLRPRERGTYLTRRWDISDRSTTRNARRTVTVAGQEIDDLDYCQVARGRASRHGLPAPDNLPILSACPGLARIPAPADDSAISSPPGPADTIAATSGAGTPPFASGTSGRASGGLARGACRARAPRACNRGRSSPALVRRTSVSSSDPRPFPAALTATGDTGRAGPGFKRSRETPDGLAHGCRDQAAGTT
jgi:hypothetical protein